jgi:hypothetical protein
MQERKTFLGESNMISKNPHKQHSFKCAEMEHVPIYEEKQSGFVKLYS